jgi:DNA recombination-dependent growth factor C
LRERKRAGRVLDSRTWDQFPEARSGRAFFRAFRVWQLDAPWTLAGDALAEVLEGARFFPCAAGQLESIGFEDVLEDHGLQREISGASVIRARIQQRALPEKAVQEALIERIREIEEREGEPVRGVRRRELVDEVRASLIPKTPTQSTRQWVVIDREQGLVLIDSATAARGEALLTLLRGCVGSLPVRPLAFARPLDGVLTSWVTSGDLPPARCKP